MSKILIVDDELSVRKMIKKILGKSDSELLDAENGVQALSICRNNNIDLLITDIVMPEKHGIDLIMQLLKEQPELPIIAISGGGGISGRFDYLEIVELLNVKSILRKPFTASELRESVTSAMAESV